MTCNWGVLKWSGNFPHLSNGKRALVSLGCPWGGGNATQSCGDYTKVLRIPMKQPMDFVSFFVAHVVDGFFPWVVP